jgi:hypothetical protein
VLALAANDGCLTARVLAQSVSLTALRKWLAGVHVPDAVRALRDYAMTYNAQSRVDADAISKLLGR